MDRGLNGVFEWMQQGNQGLFLVVGMIILTAWLFFLKTRVGNKPRMDLPEKFRHGYATTAEYEAFLKNQGNEHNLEKQPFANGETDWLDLDAPEEKHPPKVLETKAPTIADLTPEEYKLIYGNEEEIEALDATTTIKEHSEIKKIDVKQIMTKVVMRQIIDKQVDVTLNPTNFKIDDDGQVSLGDLSGKITPNQKEVAKPSYEEDNAEELIF